MRAGPERLAASGRSVTLSAGAVLSTVMRASARRRRDVVGRVDAVAVIDFEPSATAAVFEDELRTGAERVRAELSSAQLLELDAW